MIPEQAKKKNKLSRNDLFGFLAKKVRAPDGLKKHRPIFISRRLLLSHVRWFQ